MLYVIPDKWIFWAVEFNQTDMDALYNPKEYSRV